MSAFQKALALDSPEIESLGSWALSVLTIILKIHEQKRTIFQFLPRLLGVIILTKFPKL